MLDLYLNALVIRNHFMKVLNIFYNFKQGGVERLGISVANCLTKHGVDSYVCIINDERDMNLINLFDSNVHVILLKKRGQNRKIGYLKQLVTLIKKEKIDVMHVHQGTLMPFYMLVKLLCPSLKIFFTVHDTYIYSELASKYRIIANIICKKLIAISDAVVDDMTSHGLNSNMICRIYNGVKFDDFEVRTNNIVKKYPIIVNVARFFPQKKGQDTLIKAVAELKKRGVIVKVLFAGGELYEGEGSLSRMIELAEKLGVDAQIEFLGNVTDVNSLLQKANIFCIPSNYEGFGISAVEAMGTGLPCVSSNVPGLSEVVSSDRIGKKFEAGDYVGLANALQEVIQSIDSYNPQDIADYVRNRFSIDGMIHSLLQAYGD